MKSEDLKMVKVCRLISTICAIFLLSLSPLHASYNGTTQLYKDLLTSLDQRVRPSLNASLPTEVFVNINLLSLRKIDETEQYFVINAWIEFTWQDEIRTWNPSDYGGVQALYPDPNDVWRPRVIISNSIVDRDVFKDDHTNLGILSDGTTAWYPGTMFQVDCAMDMTYFPFDEQNCFMRFFTQDYASDIMLIPLSDSVQTRGYAINGEWELKSTAVTSRTVPYKTIQFSSLTATFNFRRRPAFYALNFFVPMVLLTLLSPLVFSLPEESGERVSFSVTILLSLALFVGIMSGQLPQNSDTIPLTILYLTSMVIHSGLCLVSCLLHLRWYHIKKDTDQLGDTTSTSHQDEQHHHHQKQSPVKDTQVRLEVPHQNSGKTPDRVGYIPHAKRIYYPTDPNDNHPPNGNGRVDDTGNQRSKPSLQPQHSSCSDKVKPVRTCESISANSVLFFIFITSWLAISVYFGIRIFI